MRWQSSFTCIYGLGRWFFGIVFHNINICTKTINTVLPRSISKRLYHSLTICADILSYGRICQNYHGDHPPTKGSVDPSLAITVPFGFSCLSICVNCRGLRQGCFRSSYLVEVCVWTYRNMGITTDISCCIHVTYKVTSNGSTPWRRGKSSACRHQILAGILGVGLSQGLLIPIYGHRWFR